MHKTLLGKLLIGTALLLLVPQFAFASDMGNGPAGLLVWFLGTGIALVISFISSCVRDELGAFNGFKMEKFIIVLIAQLPIVFIIGVVAIFM
jgi:hypothetical protein